MNKPTVILAQVYKTYRSGSDDLRVLRNVSLTAHEGESIAVVGASGCGKSTLLNLIGGLDQADSGKISACGFEVSKLNEKELTAYRSGGVGFMFQFHYLLKDFTALENVMLPMLMTGSGQRKAADEARLLLDKVRVADRADHFPSQLSGGERQRVALARALINDPQLILADEPTGNLDKKTGEEVFRLLLDKNKKEGITLVVVTHNEQLASMMNRRLEMTDGIIKELP
ncbi:MAG: ABC transporter ATP-binding protein [Deltaproteobacteria bacterium]|nr:ABC transporter ATP-binding protein [Deltaproteobacteria bacterium]